MNEMKKYKLDKQSLAWLAQQYEGVSTLSLYRSVKEVDSTGGVELLIDQEVMVDANRMNIEAIGVFEKLARVKEVGRLIMVTNMGNFDKTCYKFDDEVITVDQGHDNIIVQSPGNLEEAIDMYTNLFGFSNMTVSELDVDLDGEAALVFSAIIDILRQQLLGVLSSLGEENTSLVQRDQIMKQLAIGTNPLCFVSYVEALTGNLKIDANKLEEVIAGLVAQGVITDQDGQIDLTEEAKAIAENLLIVNGLIRAEVYKEVDGGMNGQKSTVLYGGPNCTLLIEKGTSGVHFYALTGIELIRYLTFIMADNI